MALRQMISKLALAPGMVSLVAITAVAAAIPSADCPDMTCPSDAIHEAPVIPEPRMNAFPVEPRIDDAEQIAIASEPGEIIFSFSFAEDPDHEGRLELERLNAGIGLERWDHAKVRPLDLTALLAGSERAWGEPGQSSEDVLASMLHYMGNTLPLGITGGLLASERASSRQAGRSARDAIIATTAATHLLKAVFDSPRPANPKRLDGFPSGHTSMSVAFARAIAGEHGNWGTAAYLWAGGVAWSRVHRGDHTTEQVIAGALLGWFIANSTASSGGGVELSVPREAGVMVPAGGVKW